MISKVRPNEKIDGDENESKALRPKNHIDSINPRQPHPPIMSHPLAARLPADLAGIPIVPTLPAAVTARALELLRLYRTLAPGSSCDRDAVAKACVRLACSEHVLPIDITKDLLVKSKKQTLAFNHALSSVRQRVPSSSSSSSTKASNGQGSGQAPALGRGLGAADVPSLAMILIKLGAITVDVSFAQQLADKMLVALRREGEVTASTPAYWIERVKLEYQCAAVYVQMKEQKTQVSLAKFAKALEMTTNKFDAVVARMQMEVKDDLEARFRPRTPTKAKRGTKRARALLGGGGESTGGEEEGEEVEDELLAPATRQPPSLSLTRPLSNTMARKRPRLAIPSDAPECELTALGQTAPSTTSSSSSSPSSAVVRPSSGTPASTMQPIRPAPTPASSRRPKPTLTPSARSSTPLANALSAPQAALPPRPDRLVEPHQQQEHDPQPLSVRPRLGIGFYSMIPMTHPCKTARFVEYLEWSDEMQDKLAAAIKTVQARKRARAKGQSASDDGEDESV
ncbi:hypothetical protein BCR44DRAFT_324507 [Catenaria anguillulae PL171]|uniref:Origin recognition complex subunit 6-domain-containing protein n=1 Tax=Catenaria anguillulae PL171 TaxID=765915 RepID=A0A1Y2HFH3_9FUNG|nr:hypothetical protein BCR44DRAFT_324507 [Catenaria anguillulae PL171]